MAVLILAGIGIARSVAPIDPKLSVDAFEGPALGAAWAGGAVAPATFRTLGGMLLAALPATQRAQLGRLLTESSEYDSRDSRQMAGIYERFANFKDVVWDGFPDAPVLSINLQMPQRAITEAVEQLVREWKEKHGIPERRRRDDSLDDYLAVWDLREGWFDGEYSGSREKTFHAISHELGIPVPTATSRYRSAFRLIAGHEYAPDLWIRLMGPFKLLNAIDASDGLLRRRPWRSPNLRPVTESVLLPGRTETESADFLAAAAVTESEIDLVDVSLDIQTLLHRGRTDEEILCELELRESCRDLIAELRRRHEER
ncbi:MAG TPA: hypothetical protein VG125_17190 [Pirellulales bacterium]|nr:hypothetical protein [Pirellulales bacterium]